MSNSSKSKVVLICLTCLTALTPTVGASQTTDHHLAFKQGLDVNSSQLAYTENSDTIRLAQAKELLGKKLFKKNIVKETVSIAALDQHIYGWTSQELKPKYKKYARRIASAIMTESKKHSFDPVFLMAVIENESSFNPEVIGSFGEIGLMQITPQTAEWISRKYHIAYTGPKSLKNPAVNIALGSAYLSYLREKFGFRGQLYLAAYNMGSRNVQRFLAQQRLPKQYPSRVMQRYVRFYTTLNNESRIALN